ncbi:MAG: SUMF1/EgtB/PvdO family nonheme iron enzyme [Candidatus Riflebacteria bacterium]|nr:SUMF1/EgtB/PvdO family nonheme iron enzyme [Candidatus Riflebacteria bacterium]
MPPVFDFEKLVGVTLGCGYKILSMIGRGSFGVVFSADELLFEQVIGQVAVKVLFPNSPEDYEAIVKEVRAMAMLQHQNLIAYRCSGKIPEDIINGALFIASELAEESLESYIKRTGKLPAEDALKVASDLASALSYLHRRGAIHRDIKPANLLKCDESWKLGDFGLIRGFEGTHIQASGRKGTLLYMAPESLQNISGPHVDVWAMGILLLESLTGQFPYKGNNEADIIMQISSVDPEIPFDLPHPLGMIINGCLVRDRYSRWNAEMVMEALSPSKAPISEIESCRETGRLDDIGSQNSEKADKFSCLPEIITNSVGMQFRLILPGSFNMGSDKGGADEQPIHKVILTKPFYISLYPATQAQYEYVLEKNPSRFRGPNRPVENVSFIDTLEFIAALSSIDSSDYRLPTEAEWEYACRCTRETEFPWGDSFISKCCWCCENSDNQTHEVGLRLPNSWGLYDMNGHIWEWCSDFYARYLPDDQIDPFGPSSGVSRVIRGGAFENGPGSCRCAARGGDLPESRSYNTGFRLVKNIKL